MSDTKTAEIEEGKIMEKEDFFHLAGAAALCILAISFLMFDCHTYASLFIVFLLCLYIVLLLIECAHRSKNGSGNVLFELPNRGWAMLLVCFMVCTNVIAFANVYKQSKGVETEINHQAQLLTENRDAIYFSAVTVTTLGYGDFSPNENGRTYVVLQLASGLLLFLIIIPVVAARITDWE